SLSADHLWKEGLARLTRRIPSIDSDPVGTGGIYAFLGTTGVGKTTTIAKLAARYVMEHGAEQVALLTTDTFRIAAHDQLRSLGRILNVQVQVVNDLKQLPAILKKFSQQALVLIDTPGMSYSDPLLKAHLTALRQCRNVQNALVLSANSQYQLMQASLHSYRIANPRFCVMTKLDECASLGGAISLLTSNDLPIAYVTNGQAVPNDLAVIKPHQLLARAVKLGKLPIVNKASG
ncbi:MAG: flagellar biosynthesis protein FlhF, partial [Pseudomonadota bacterium]